MTAQIDFADAESAAFLHSKDGDDEASQQPQQEQQGRPRAGPWTRLRRLAPYVLLVFGAVLVLSIMVAAAASPRTVEQTTSTQAPADASQALLGTIPTEQVTFEPDPRYNGDPFGPDELDSPWTAIPPRGKGHIRVTDPAAYGLAGGYPLRNATPGVPAEEEYTLALYHQLHCLAALRSRMARLQAWYDGGSDSEYLHFALGDEQVSARHIDHCFDYLRQALLCHGDTTLEGARTVVDAAGTARTVRGVDGWGVTHACRDHARIYAFAEAHRSRNDTGIA